MHICRKPCTVRDGKKLGESLNYSNKNLHFYVYQKLSILLGLGSTVSECGITKNNREMHQEEYSTYW